MNSRVWQYRVVEIRTGLLGGFDRPAVRAHLDDLGAAGWELVSTWRRLGRSICFFFKRRRDSDTDAAGEV